MFFQFYEQFDDDEIGALDNTELEGFIKLDSSRLEEVVKDYFKHKMKISVWSIGIVNAIKSKCLQGINYHLIFFLPLVGRYVSYVFLTPLPLFLPFIVLYYCYTSFFVLTFFLFSKDVTPSDQCGW